MKGKLELENELRDVVSRLISQVSIASKQTRPDINLASEDAWIPILREVFHAPKLENLNRHQANFPGIDLGDTENRICFQVTSTTDIEKVKETLKTYVTKQYFNTFDDLYVFTLLPRQKRYSQEAVDKIIGTYEFEFSTKEHIIDPEIIVQKITGMRFATQQRLLRELKAVAGDIDAKICALDTKNDVPYIFASNLVPIFYPTSIFSAAVDIDTDRIWEAAKEFLPALPRKKSTHACIYLSIELSGLSATPFVFHENKIFTFENIENSPAFLGLIDKGTIEEYESSEFYESEFVEYENIFKQLLKKAIQGIVDRDAVKYSPKDRLFYFLPNQDGLDSRKLAWKDKRQAERTVYDQISSIKDSSKVYAHRHFGFDITFTKVDRQWFGIIYPSWIFTSNLKRKHPDNKNLVTAKKKLEKNQSVRNHVRFVASYLNERATSEKALIQFEKLVEFEFKHSEIIDLADENSELGVEQLNGI